MLICSPQSPHRVGNMDNPLNQSNYKEINASLAKLNQAKLQVEAAKRAGVPVDELELVVNHYEERLNALKQVYFKDKP